LTASYFAQPDPADIPAARYTVLLFPDRFPDGRDCWSARLAECPNVGAWGWTQVEALERLQDVLGVLNRHCARPDTPPAMPEPFTDDELRAVSAHLSTYRSVV
jgi:predicted RNase H-like HicB family nuclease